MDRSNDSSLVIKEHNFQAAKNSLKKFTEQAEADVAIDAVETDGGFLWLGDHRVTGSELNTITSQISDHFIRINNFNSGVVKELTEVYNAFEALDKDYIAGILIGVKSAEEASKKATKNVESIEKIVEVLKKFNSDLKRLNHLMDIDTAWNLIEKQELLLRELKRYKAELSELEHLRDVDKLWNSNKSHAKVLEEYQEMLVAIEKHVSAQNASISAFTKEIADSQQSFLKSSSKQFLEYQGEIDRHFNERETAFQTRFDKLAGSVNQLQNDQNKQISAELAGQAEQIASIKQAQIERLSKFEQMQAEELEQISTQQAKKFEQVHQEQVEQLESINQSLENEKASLNSMVALLSKKVKSAYIVAGSAVVIAAIHLLLNMVGVL